MKRKMMSELPTYLMQISKCPTLYTDNMRIVHIVAKGVKYKCKSNKPILDTKSY